MNNNETPYATLTPDLILNAVESLGFISSGSLMPLNSFENRVYQVGIDEASPLIAKFYRPARWSNEAIIEEHQFALELKALEIPVIAPLEINGATLHEFEGFRFALFPRQGGRALEVDNMEQLEQMGRFIGRIHAVGSVRPFTHRIRLDAETYGYQPFHFMRDHHFIPAELQHNFSAAVESALEMIQQKFSAAEDTPWIRLHGDCHAGNILCHDQSMFIVDLDDCLMGPAVQDIWMMLSGSKSDTEQQLKHILDGYYEFYDFDPRELRLIEALRTLRMIHYAGWLARRWDDPAFPANFPWFNTPQYWDKQLHNLREQVDILGE